MAVLNLAKNTTIHRHKLRPIHHKRAYFQPNLQDSFQVFADEVKAGADRPLLDIYTHAKKAQMDYYADETVHIADHDTAEPLVIDGVPVTVDGKLIMTTTSASVQRAKLRVESRRWVAERLAHRKYGNKLEVSGDPERPLAGLTTEQLILRQKQLQDKLDGGN